MVNLSKKISAPSGMTKSSGYISTYGQMYGSKLYLTAYYSFENTETYDYQSSDYILILNKNKVTVTNVTEKIAKKNSGKTVGSISVDVCYSATSYKALIRASLYSSDDYSYDYAYYMTSNGTSFKKIADVPEKDGYSTDIEWIGTKLYAFNEASYSDGSVLESSGNKAVYYVYQSGTWKKKKTTMKSSNGYTRGSVRNGDSYYYASCYGYDSILELVENNTKSCRISYTKDGTSWKTLPAIKFSYTSKGDVRSVYVDKTDAGTFAEVTYTISDEKKFVAVYQLKSGKWKELEALTVKNVKDSTLGDEYEYSHFSINFYSKTASMIYYDGSKTKGYNLKTGKTYVLPFKYGGNNVVGGDTKIYHYKNKLYGTKDTYKTVTAIALKVGKKKISTDISETYYGSTKKNTFEYLKCGSKVYVVSFDTMIKAVK